MQSFSVETAGFVALTLTELLIQECVLKGILAEDDVKRLLAAAKKRHETIAASETDAAGLNTDAAHMISALTAGLAPLFEQVKMKPGEMRRKQSATVSPEKPPENGKD